MMRKTMRKGILVAAVSFLVSLSGFAEPSSSGIMTVDMIELYNKYDKAQEAKEKLATAYKNAQDEINKMIEEGLKIHENYQELQAKASNPALTEEARQKFADEAKKKGVELQDKDKEITEYKQRIDSTLTQRQQTLASLHREEIKKAAGEVAKKKGGTHILPKSLFIYYDETKVPDETDAILALLNKSSGKSTVRSKTSSTRK